MFNTETVQRAARRVECELADNNGLRATAVVGSGRSGIGAKQSHVFVDGDVLFICAGRHLNGRARGRRINGVLDCVERAQDHAVFVGDLDRAAIDGLKRHRVDLNPAGHVDIGEPAIAIAAHDAVDIVVGA